MKVSDILRVKGNTLYTVTPDEPLMRAIDTMGDTATWWACSPFAK